MNEEERANLRRNLVRPADIADRAFVERAAVSNWRKRFEDFPRPVFGKEDGSFGIYWWPEIAAFMQAHNLPGRARRDGKKMDEKMIRAYGWPGFDLD